MNFLYLILIFSLGFNIYFISGNKVQEKVIKSVKLEKESASSKKKVQSKYQEKTTEIKTMSKEPTIEKKPNTITRDEEKDYVNTEDMTYDYSEKRRQYISELKDYMIKELDIGLEEANRVMEFQEERSKELSEYMTSKLKRIHEKYGQDAPYIYQAEDHIMLGKSIQKSSRRISKFLGQEKFEKLKEHVERNLYTGDGLHILEL